MAGADVRVLVIAEAGQLSMRELVEAAGARVRGPIAWADAAGALAESGQDAVLADLRRADADTAAALLEALEGRRSAILIDREQLDDAAGAVLAGEAILLCEGDAIDQAVAVRQLLTAAPRATAREEDEAEPAERLRRISGEMDRLARSLADLSVSAAPARAGYVAAAAPGFRGPRPTPEVSAPAIRDLIRARRQRAQFFDPTLFADPAWDMLLDLMAAGLEAAQVSVSSLCIAAAVPPTTALRWIKQLADLGLILRLADPKDRRRVFIALSDATADAMAACLSMVARTARLAL